MKNLSKNPFLAFGVSADADLAEIRKVAQRQIMEHRLDGGANSPAARRIETALEQLQDPVERFHWGLYWPELTKEEVESFRADPILSTLADNPTQDGATAYDRLAAHTHSDIHAHNLGVLSLLQAIAATEAAQKSTPDDTSDDIACAQLWKRAFQHLLPIASSESFWLRKKLWARELGDKRLNDAKLASIRESYIPELLAPIGSVITAALLAGHSSVAKVYVNIFRTSGFADTFVDATLSTVYKPLADRIERTVQGLKTQLQDVAKTVTSEHVFAQLLASFECDAMKDIEAMLAVGDLPGYAEEHARDTAAQFLRELSVSSWNRGNHSALAERTIALATRIADSASIRTQLNEDKATIAKLVQERQEEQRLAPRFAQLKQLLDAKKWQEALPVISELQAATSGTERQKMAKLHFTISNNLAGEYFKRAAEALKSRSFAEAHRNIDEALRYSLDLELIALLLDARARLPRNGLAHAVNQAQKAGCLMYLLAPPIIIALKYAT